MDARLIPRWRSESTDRDVDEDSAGQRLQHRQQSSVAAGDSDSYSPVRGPMLRPAPPLATSALGLRAITGAQFEQLVLRPGRDVLLLYHSPTCGANRFLYPQLLHLELLAASLLPRLLIYTCDLLR